MYLYSLILLACAKVIISIILWFKNNIAYDKFVRLSTTTAIDVSHFQNSINVSSKLDKFSHSWYSTKHIYLYYIIISYFVHNCVVILLSWMFGTHYEFYVCRKCVGWTWSKEEDFCLFEAKEWKLKDCGLVWGPRFARQIDERAKKQKKVWSWPDSSMVIAKREGGRAKQKLSGVFYLGMWFTTHPRSYKYPRKHIEKTHTTL